MQATIEEFSQISIFKNLPSPRELKRLQPHTQVQHYKQGEIVIHEGARLSAKLYALVKGFLQVTKSATTGKETRLRILPAGEIFAAPVWGDGIAPAMVTATCNTQILTIEREALLEAIGQTPEIALHILAVFNSRLQQLHGTIHGLVSERAIVRLARLILYLSTQYGTEPSPSGQQLKAKLSYYQIARSIGITYEECVRLFRSLKGASAYSRGGKITLLRLEELEAIASGTVCKQLEASGRAGRTLKTHFDS